MSAYNPPFIVRGPTMWRIALAATLFVASTALAEDAAQRRAREELERELKQMVGTPPTRVRVEFVSPDEPNYKLEEATFEVDGKAVPAQPLTTLASEGTHTVFSGDVTPGKHKVSAKLVFANGTSAVLSDEGGYKWKVGGDASFEVAPGLEVQVQIVPARDSSQKDISKRFTLRMPAAPVMVAKLDDGKMPEPMAKSAEAAKMKADAEKAAALAAAAPLEPKPVGAVAAAEVPKTDEPRRPVVDRPQGIAVGEPNPSTPVPVPTPVEAVAPVPVADVVVEDAGSSAPVALTVPEEEGPNGTLWLLAGAGVIALILIVAVARRRARVPTIRD